MKPKALIADLDGTLVDVSGLRHYVEGRDRDFDSFHKASILAPANDWVVDELAARQDTGLQVLIVTARQEKYWHLTHQWLEKYGVKYNRMYMRKTGDQRCDYQVKQEVLAKIEQEYEVIHAYDDNPSTFKLWLQHNIPTTVVPGWPPEAYENGGE